MMNDQFLKWNDDGDGGAGSGSSGGGSGGRGGGIAHINWMCQ